MMLVQSPMVPWLVLVCIAAVSTLPESHADQTTVQTSFCAGYNITVHTTPVTFAAATADCRREKLFILRLKDYNRRRNVACFKNITDGFMDNGTSDIWLRNYNRLNATINLETELVRNLTELASTAMQPFICAKDWNECEDPATKCPAGTFCENVKGGYVCEACGQGNALGRSTVDGRTGLVTCEIGYHWTCSSGNCPRDSETPAKLVCENQVLTNLPECAVGTPSFPGGYDASNVIIDPNTSTFACAAGYYAQCTANTTCAGGLNNLPAIASQQAVRLVWTNLPTCHQLGQITCSGTRHWTGITSDVAIAKQACQEANTTLMNDLYLTTLSPFNRSCLLAANRPVWLFDSTGNGEVFKSSLEAAAFIPAAANAGYLFICLPIDYRQQLAASAPDVDTSLENPTCLSGSEEYTCNASLNHGPSDFTLCLPYCVQRPAALELKSTAFCHGFNLTISLESVPYSVGSKFCREQNSNLVRKTFHERLMTTKCYIDVLAKLNASGVNTVWTKSPGRVAGRYNLATDVSEHIYSKTKSAADAIICASDWDECTHGTPCPAGFACTNLKGSYRCDRVLCPATSISNGAIGEANLKVKVRPTCDTGYTAVAKATCKDEGWSWRKEPCQSVDSLLHSTTDEMDTTGAQHQLARQSSAESLLVTLGLGHLLILTTIQLFLV
ncbi:uncharacterized protein LOC135825793 [Sycon ciliatum]|uniref:uncharacterized protein LOC135825793 n=1 Tax=Sycon ciliatum TaxID=27933 RepID=UPI0031F698AE